MLSFNDQRLNGDNDPSWAVVKDGGRFDQFTGATITPRAVVGAVKQAILTFNEHRTALLEDDNDSNASDGGNPNG